MGGWFSGVLRVLGLGRLAGGGTPPTPTTHLQTGTWGYRTPQTGTWTAADASPRTGTWEHATPRTGTWENPSV